MQEKFYRTFISPTTRDLTAMNAKKRRGAQREINLRMYKEITDAWFNTYASTILPAPV
jgi:hypothetical protein